MEKTPNRSGSSLLLDEYFSAQDDRFMDELRACDDARKMAGLAERWKKDPRPWARTQLLAYLELPLSCNGHQPLVKRMFKHAEAMNDGELMAAFMVAFDRLARRTKSLKRKWDRDAQEMYFAEVLVSPDNVLKPKTQKPSFFNRSPAFGELGLLFSYRTRYYLRRRSLRYFRRMGFRQPADYIHAVSLALTLYSDSDFQLGENILDNWSLLHICFGEHDAIEFDSSRARLKENRTMGELTASPMFSKAWGPPDAVPVLMSLLFHARSRLVRVWSTQVLRAKHADALKQLMPEDLVRLLDHDDDEIQQFGAEIFSTATGLEKLPLAAWLKLLQTKNMIALQTVCDMFAKNVQSERLELQQCVTLACERAQPVARLGVAMLKDKKIETLADRACIAGVASARCAAVGRELAEWVLTILGEKSVYDRDLVSRFFDSLLSEMREGAWDWLLTRPMAYDDAGLWARLVETPYEDVRLKMVDLLQKRASLPGVAADTLAPLWCSVLLAIHRGGRQKSRAVRQIGGAIIADPRCAHALIPVLAVALHSVRPAEARAGLATLVMAVDARPELAGVVSRYIPDLILTGANA